MKAFTIQPNDAGQRLDKFLTKAAPNLPQALLYKAIRTKNVKVNGKRGLMDTRLAEGDVVAVYLKDEFFTPRADGMDFLSAPRALNIAYEDDNLLVLDKPAGLLSHADGTQFIDTLIARVLRYLYEAGQYDPKAEQSFAPALVNRIDRNTGGLVIAAKNAQTLRILNEKMKAREIKKEYLCVLSAVPKPPQGILEGYLEKNSESNTVRVFREGGANRKEIRTKYQLLSEKDGRALVQVELLTGRTHQIRAHFAAIGCPLLGDGKYGRLAGEKKQLLYSFRLTFDFASDAGELNYLKGTQVQAREVWFAEEF